MSELLSVIRCILLRIIRNLYMFKQFLNIFYGLHVLHFKFTFEQFAVPDHVKISVFEDWERSQGHAAMHALDTKPLAERRAADW